MTLAQRKTLKTQPYPNSLFLILVVVILLVLSSVMPEKVVIRLFHEYIRLAILEYRDSFVSG